MNHAILTECAPFYHNYINQVPEGDIIELLERQFEKTLHLLEPVCEEKADHRYAPNKWSIKELIGHIIDSERVFAYRALCFARNDTNPLPGMEQDDWVKYSNLSKRTLKDFLNEFRLVRLANILLFKSFDEEISMRKGMASGFEFSVRALVYIIAGHEKHHFKVLKEKYL